MTGPDGLRVLVVGASSGIGRATALALAAGGASVAVAARRLPPLLEVADAAHDGRARAFPCDVTDERACHRLVDDAAAWLGGLDAVVYAAGSAPLGRVEATGAARWQSVLSTNVVGAALVVARALPHLRRSTAEAGRAGGGGGTVVLLSSHSVGHPWPGLVPYAASKAALDELARGLRAEEPEVRMVRMVVGNTATPFADGWDPAAADEALTGWLAGGYLRHRVLEPAEVAAAVLAALAGDGPDDVWVVGEDDPGHGTATLDVLRAPAPKTAPGHGTAALDALLEERRTGR